jgi:FKBP-type peptidyl-prolyl cis-trans isomerase
MKRLVLAFVAALTISACSPGGAVDAKDPLTALQPWNHSRAGVEKLPNGVEYYVVRKGDAKEAAPGPKDMVEVKYEGRLAATGLVFDSSYQRGDTAKFRLNQVIPGWTAGMQKMQPGDMFVFWIPSKEGYGERGQGMDIPPNADLMFQVELLKVVADPWGKVAPWPTDASNIVRLPSGLEYFPIESGAADGASPTDADEVVVNFEGRLEGVKAEAGETEDDVRRRSLVASTFEEGQPKYFPVKDLVPGWAEVLKLMRKGDRWMVRMPSQLLYQAEGDGRIPPDATVLYELELLDFSAPPPAGQGPTDGPIPPT